MILKFDLGPSAPGQQQTPAATMNQPGMNRGLQFPSPQLNKSQAMNTIGAQGTMQQVVPLGQVQQPTMAPQQVFYNKSGMTQEQILAQHLQQHQQQQTPQQHQLTPQAMMSPQAMSVNSQNQGAHHQITQTQSYISPNQGASPMPVQQQPVHQGLPHLHDLVVVDFQQEYNRDVKMALVDEEAGHFRV